MNINANIILNQKYNNLKAILTKYERICIAYSGGVDSTFLLKAAKDVLGNQVLPILVNGAMMPRSEYHDAIDISESIGISPLIINADIFSVPQFTQNAQDRCYHCKKFIFQQIQKAASSKGFSVLMDGSNIDDDNDYRPGIKALNELGVISPLKEAQLNKRDIRELSSYFKLKTSQKPAMACLATRIPTNSPIDSKILEIIEAGEEILKDLNLKQYRLRVIGRHGKIECSSEDFNTIFKFRDFIVTELEKLGLKSITLDLSGYKQGKMNSYENGIK
ncbi:MAG: ATP-dependent sacrificial sulfur transferase LarE [Bacteroidales bacterium]